MHESVKLLRTFDPNTTFMHAEHRNHGYQPTVTINQQLNNLPSKAKILVSYYETYRKIEVGGESAHGFLSEDEQAEDVTHGADDDDDGRQVEAQRSRDGVVLLSFSTAVEAPADGHIVQSGHELVHAAHPVVNQVLCRLIGWHRVEEATCHCHVAHHRQKVVTRHGSRLLVLPDCI